MPSIPLGPYRDDCRRYDRGLHLAGPDDRLAVSGSFDTARPSGYLGCHNFFHPD
jgi:hypothetical protein